MKPSKKYVLSVFIIFILFILFINSAGFFKIGLLSDDYLNFYDAVRSSPAEKFSGTLPFTNPLHFRPLYYFSLQISSYVHDALGFTYDNFIFYRIQNLILYFIIVFTAGRIVLLKTKRVSYAVFAAASILLFPNNIHNICWTAGRADLLCCMFYLGSIYFSLIYFEKKSKPGLVLALIFFLLALMSKETAVTLPFAVLIFLYITENKTSIRENLLYISAIGVILIIYLMYRTAVLNPGFIRYYDSGYLSLFLKCLVSLTIPLGYLDLKLLILSGDVITIAYLLIILSVLTYYIILFIKKKFYKNTFSLVILVIVLIAPYLYADYIRPQLILIPFSVIVIYLFISFDRLKKYFTEINTKPFIAILIILLAFFTYYSFNIIKDWSTAYNNAVHRMESLLNTGIETNRHNIIVGNAGRLKQSFLFDKLTGAYGYWKNKNFIVNDTINDIVQTGALDTESLNSPLNYREITPGEFEISAAGKTQYFYMEGFNDDKAKWTFANREMSVEATAYNFFNKPSKIRLKILSPDVNCYLASEVKYYKIY